MVVGTDRLVSVEEVRARIDQIRLRAAEGHSDGDCHAEQDELWADVLTTIASGFQQGPACVDLAKAALETLGIDFPRWFE
jgi:hypothetical protein